jgi:UbiD family decarboxylase
VTTNGGDEMITDLRGFLQQLEAVDELRGVTGASLAYEIGCISEISFQNRGPALIFDQIPGYDAGYRIASNLCSTRERSLMAIGTDPSTPEAEAMRAWQKKWERYEGLPPKVVDKSRLLENVLLGDAVDLGRIPVPTWHELDGGPYIGSGVAVILKDPETGYVNLGSYRLQVHGPKTTGLFCEPVNDGARIIRKYWDQGKACPVAVSVGPEPLIFLTASGSTGCPSGTPEYDYTGFLCGEPVEVIEGQVTGIPISAGSEIAFEGEIPPPEVESRPEGPFGEWTGYYMITSVPEPVIRVKALYYRNDPILLGAPPFKPHRESYAFSLPMRSMTGLWTRLEKKGLPVTRVTDLVKMGAVIISVQQRTADDVPRIVKELQESRAPCRISILVDDDVNAEDPTEVFWALGTRLDAAEGVHRSVVQSAWRLDPMRTAEEREIRSPIPYKRLILNACRPFERIKEFSPVNRFSETRRADTWEKWNMGEWLKGSW